MNFKSNPKYLEDYNYKQNQEVFTTSWDGLEIRKLIFIKQTNLFVYTQEFDSSYINRSAKTAISAKFRTYFETYKDAIQVSLQNINACIGFSNSQINIDRKRLVTLQSHKDFYNYCLDQKAPNNYFEYKIYQRQYPNYSMFKNVLLD